MSKHHRKKEKEVPLGVSVIMPTSKGKLFYNRAIHYIPAGSTRSHKLSVLYALVKSIIFDAFRGE